MLKRQRNEYGYCGQLIRLNYQWSLHSGMPKPKSFEFKGIDTLPTDIAKIVGVIYKEAVYTCGTCNALIIFPYTSARPIRCKKCGDNIDWIATNKKKIKICPGCNRTDFELEDEFCDSCPSQIRLRLTEI